MSSQMWLSSCFVVFSVTPLNLLFPSVLFHFPFATFHPPLSHDNTIFSHLFLPFPHSTVCQFVCLSPTLILLFRSLPQPFRVVSFLSFRLSQQSPESKRSWLTQFVLRLSAREKRKLRVRNQERSFSDCVLDSAALSRRHADIHTHTHTHTHTQTKTLWLSHHQARRI